MCTMLLQNTLNVYHAACMAVCNLTLMLASLSKLLRGDRIAGMVHSILQRAYLRAQWRLQLIDKWRASKVPEDGKVGKSMSREDNERVIGQLLYDGYLQFDFSYTAYATNAYLKASQRASLILQGEQSPCCAPIIGFQ